MNEIENEMIQSGIPETSSVKFQNFNSIDAASAKGQFGWTTIDHVHIPYVYRYGEKFCCAKMVEVALLEKHLRNFNEDFYSTLSVESFCITETENKLFLDINKYYCDDRFGDSNSQYDYLIKLSDLEQLIDFLSFCHKRLTTESKGIPDKCGFLRIDGASIVPYLILNGEKLLPSFYFDELPLSDIKLRVVQGWDWSYVKFCCKVQGIKTDLIPVLTGLAVCFNDIVDISPPSTTFEFCWPCPVNCSTLLATGDSKNKGKRRWMLLPKPGNQEIM